VRKTGQARFARVPIGGGRRVNSFDHREPRRGQAAPWTKRHSAMNLSPAARLGRAARRLIGEETHAPITALGTRTQRASPVYLARNAAHFAR